MRAVVLIMHAENSVFKIKSSKNFECLTVSWWEIYWVRELVWGASKLVSNLLEFFSWYFLYIMIISVENRRMMEEVNVLSTKAYHKWDARGSRSSKSHGCLKILKFEFKIWHKWIGYLRFSELERSRRKRAVIKTTASAKKKTGPFFSRTQTLFTRQDETKVQSGHRNR